MEIEELVKTVINASYCVARALCPGYMETVYQNALCHELRKRNIQYDKEAILYVKYDGEVVGQYRADVLVENQLILELKALSAITDSHEIQLVNYLTTTGIDHGLLINFGVWPIEIKRKYRVYRKTK